MKTKIKRLVFLSVMVIIALSASAQDSKQKRTPEERAAKQTEMMTQKLQLTTDQQAKIKDINLKYAKKRDTDMAAAKEDRAKMKEAAKADMSAKDAEFQKILTPDQYKQWQDVKQEAKKEGKEKMKEKKGK